MEQSVKELVDGLIAENQVVIFSKEWCPFCAKAKDAFASAGYPDGAVKVVELETATRGEPHEGSLASVTGFSGPDATAEAKKFIKDNALFLKVEAELKKADVLLQTTGAASTVFVRPFGG